MYLEQFRISSIFSFNVLVMFVQNPETPGDNQELALERKTSEEQRKESSDIDKIDSTHGKEEVKIRSFWQNFSQPNPIFL